ncbi:hypothetical protein KUCAC02_006039, partial [Chaenocephalus aceratus]
LVETQLCGVLDAKWQSVSARRPLSAGLLGDETGDQAALHQTLRGLFACVSVQTPASQQPGPNMVRFCAGTIYQEFSSAGIAVGLIPIHSICTGISAAGEESV